VKRGAFALALLLWPLFASAEGPLQANRLGKADPPTVLAPGVAHIESGITFERETGNESDADGLTAPDLELRLGVFQRVELQLYADGLVQEWRGARGNPTGGSDLELDARVALFPQAGWRPATAVEVGVSFPVGSDFATSAGFDPKGEILYAWDFAEVWNLTGNLDFVSETQGDDDHSRSFVFRPELALGLGITERWSTFIEYFGVIDSKAADQHSIDAGVLFLVSHQVQLDLNAGVGLNAAAPDFFVGVGVAWELPRLWE
jgi:hypothetical protein